jgi:hypothetical protein
VRSHEELRAIRDSVELVGKLSDGLVRFGPFSLGIDGVLSWIPGVGEIYNAGAAAFLLAQGARAGVPKGTLAVCGALMLTRTGVDAIPFAGAIASDLFTAHKWSAKLIARAIDKQLAAQGADPKGPQAQRRRWRAFADAPHRPVTP